MGVGCIASRLLFGALALTLISFITFCCCIPHLPRYVVCHPSQQQQQQASQQQASQQPVEQTARTTTIRNHVNLKKNTLEVVSVDPATPDKLMVKFSFDANVECWCSVFLVASETPREGCSLTPASAAAIVPHRTKHPQARLAHSSSPGQGHRPRTITTRHARRRTFE